MTQTLLYYNRSTEAAFPLRDALDAACRDLGRMAADGMSPLVTADLDHQKECDPWLEQCRIAVVHGFPKHFGRSDISDGEKWNEWISSPEMASGDRLVIIRVSTGFLYDAAQRVSFGHAGGGGRVRYLLPVWDTKHAGLSAARGERVWDSAVRKWTQFLRIALDPNLLDRWFAGTGWPPEFEILNALVGTAHTREFLSGLTILCQGYLAVYACSGRNRKPGHFERALKRMGYPSEELEAERDARPKNQKAISRVLAESESLVTQGGWWANALDGDEQVILGHLMTELGDDRLPEHVSQLVSRICVKGARGIDLDTVSAAYLELVDILEGRL